ncbi:MAG: HigA family addiction module antidote protein [Alphaproteobacteria bacterium]|nr:HigA family addiction module antidote protein [Alphaproteobacteria bacterium]
MARIMTHPGEVLREEFMEPLNLSANQLGKLLGIAPNRISDIVRCRRKVTADTALRLAKCFSTTPEFWMNLQLAYDVSVAIHDHGEEIEREVSMVDVAA